MFCHLVEISKHIFLLPEILKKGFGKYLLVNLRISREDISSICEFKSSPGNGYRP